MGADSQIVEVQLSDRNYEIHIGAGILSRIGKLVDAASPSQHAVIVTDENVEEPYGRIVAESLANQSIEVDLLVVPAGETSKSVEFAELLWNRLLDLGADRSTVVVAVGGGVVGDLAGFVAASFARGLPLVQVPTTLLAQVDSSVGGKTGINLPGAKNMVGAFWQPRAVAIDVNALTTLPEREYLSGLAETVKYGVILDEPFFSELESSIEAIGRRDEIALTRIVARCCQLKADVVRQDEREETGLRAVLNYGHTFAHGLEAATDYGVLLHGEAVAIGMACAARLAVRLGLFNRADAARQQALLDALGLSTEVPSVPLDRVLAAMRRDKKSQQGRMHFVLPRSIGHVETVEVADEQTIRAALMG